MAPDSRDVAELLDILHSSGKQIREISLSSVLMLHEAELIRTRVAAGDEEFTVDREPAEILRRNLHNYATRKNVGIEIVGEAFGTEMVGSGTPRYIVHVDVVDGTRELTHKVGLSYFEAGILPYKQQNPVLADTVAAVAVTIGFDPITGGLYSYFSDPKGSYRLNDTTLERTLLIPSKETEFNTRGFFNVMTAFSGTGAMHVLRDKMFERMYGPPSADIFNREIITVCGEWINIARGSSRGAMDFRPALPLIGEKLAIPSAALLSMHPYDVSAVWPIVRDTTEGMQVMFLDSALKEIKPSEIPIRNVDFGLGFLACGNSVLFEKARSALRDVLGQNYF